MGNDDDGVFPLELEDQILDARGRGRVEGGGRFVEKQDIGTRRQGTSNAQPLLLAA